MYVRPQIEGQTTTFGVSGKLWRDSLVMYDRETGSLWSQLLGRAIAGPLDGRELEEIPSVVTTWKAWKTRHPDTVVLKKSTREVFRDRRERSEYDEYRSDYEKIGLLGSENPDDRLPGKQLVYGIEHEGSFSAVPYLLLEQQPVANVDAFGLPLVVVSPQEEVAAMAWVRRVDGAELLFEEVRGKKGRLSMRDTATASTWSWETGECLDGAHRGKRLERIVGLPVYWGIWAQFHPDSGVVDRYKKVKE